MTYISRAQWAQLLAPIKPERVQIKDRQSNVAAYDIRAHLNRVFGFGRWSGDVVDCTMIYDYESALNSGQPGRAVAYRVTYRLTVNAPDGAVLATYTETAVGAQKMGVPSHGDCHDFAIKTAESQAFKRCAVNLGDQFGLSLYNNGSRAALVGGTIPMPEDPPNLTVGPVVARVDAHITEPLAPENSPVGPAEQEPVAAPTRQETDPVADVRARALAATKKREVMGLISEVARDGLGGQMTTDADGKGLFMDKFLAARLKEVA